MTETSTSLLDRVRKEEADSWRRLVDLYSPLIRNWLGRQGLTGVSVDDVVQDVFSVVIRRVGDFDRQPHAGAFRGWLRTISVNCLRDHWRSQKKHGVGSGKSDMQAMLEQLSDPDSGLSRQWDAEHDGHVLQYLLDSIRGEFAEATWEAFERVAIKGEKPAEVAKGLGLSVNAVFIAKSRVLKRLREEGAGLIDEVEIS